MWVCPGNSPAICFCTGYTCNWSNRSKAKWDTPSDGENRKIGVWPKPTRTVSEWRMHWLPLRFSFTARGVSLQANPYLSQTYKKERRHQTDRNSRCDAETLEGEVKPKDFAAHLQMKGAWSLLRCVTNDLMIKGAVHSCWGGESDLFSRHS